MPTLQPGQTIDPRAIALFNRSHITTAQAFASFILKTEPWPHLIYYYGGRVTYVDPDHIPLLRGPAAPSDCVWIVPGTTRC
jgi:hypothetical protein